MPFTHQDLQRSIDSTGAPSYVTDGHGRILGWNSAAESALGHSRGDVLGRPCHMVIDGRDSFGNRICKPDCPVKLRARSGQAVHRFRMYARAEAGHYVEVECSSLCIRSDEGDEAIIHLLRTWPIGSDRLPRHRRRNPSQPGPEDIERLTDREMEVLQLLATGFGTRQLAETLSISVATVRSHVENILQKLGVHSRLEAVVAAVRIGLV